MFFGMVRGAGTANRVRDDYSTNLLRKPCALVAPSDFFKRSQWGVGRRCAKRFGNVTIQLCSGLALPLTPMLDIKASYSITMQGRQLKHLVQEYEKLLTQRLPACSAKVGYHVETSCTVLVRNNVGLGQFYKVKVYVLAASRIGQDYYPE
ncbi:hypothetical protein M422DRAFT_272134 [Sphaerobolus stellatus SS14]|uniref:Uncharacterized protein n=1 Tax=Sphaerobolus stellatus (strain SS14) TaxID=990650 RepID=A0A0C9UNC1_SPHS4|nr:hypothetical protein M422DRAFT_272134 [Sphaerobolus stellatus SS14]